MIEAARAALRNYLETIIFDEANPEGELLRAALAGRRDPARLEALRSRLLREADHWGPGSPEWRAIEARDATVTYAGRLLNLYTEVRLGKSGRVEHTLVSLD